VMRQVEVIIRLRYHERLFRSVPELVLNHRRLREKALGLTVCCASLSLVLTPKRRIPLVDRPKSVSIPRSMAGAP
jgi:hypothetical protein